MSILTIAVRHETWSNSRRRGGSSGVPTDEQQTTSRFARQVVRLHLEVNKVFPSNSSAPSVRSDDAEMDEEVSVFNSRI